jgi:hypothetical protein
MFTSAAFLGLVDGVIGGRALRLRLRPRLPSHSSAATTPIAGPMYRARIIDSVPLSVDYTTGGRLPVATPAIREIAKMMMNTQNSSLAMPAEVAARPPKPSAAATSANTRKTSAQRSIGASREAE